MTRKSDKFLMIKSLPLLLLAFLAFGTASASAVNFRQDMNSFRNGPDLKPGDINSGWNVDTYSKDALQVIEIGLRAKEKYQIASDTTPTDIKGFDGTYSVDDASGTNPGFLASWNFDYSLIVNPDIRFTTLFSFDFRLSVDIDPTDGQDWVSFNPNALLLFNTRVGLDSARNSLNAGIIPGYDKNAPATYDFFLTAWSQDCHPVLLADTYMRVEVNGGFPSDVPDGGTTLLMLGAMVPGMAMLRRRMGRNR